MKKKSKRKSKYNDKKIAEKYALKAMSDYIRERDNWICFTCGYKGNNKTIDCGHFVPRGYSYWKFDERNNHAQCTRENQYMHGNWPVYYEKMCELYGKEFVEEMINKKNIMVKRIIQDFNEIEEYYKNKLKELYEKRAQKEKDN